MDNNYSRKFELSQNWVTWRVGYDFCIVYGIVYDFSICHNFSNLEFQIPLKLNDSMEQSKKPVYYFRLRHVFQHVRIMNFTAI